MKKIIFFVVIWLIVPHLSAQMLDRTVNMTNIPNVNNYPTLTAALSGATSGMNIFVAAGIYQEAELTIPAGVIVTGGFPTNASSITQRIFPGVATPAQLSILDGNYQHRVATVNGTLDGFVITKGYAYENGANGGGVLIDGGIVQNCILKNNVASNQASTTATIPGNFVASVGDIYCKDLNGKNDTIIRPTYTLNQNTGILSANFSGSIPPAGKAVEGIVFYVDPKPANRLLFIVSKPFNGKIWSGDYTFDTPIANVSSFSVAINDYSGENHTDSVTNFVNSQIQSWVSTDWRTQTWNSLSAFVAVNNYDSPSGTKGEWYLPAAGEVVKLVDVKKQIDACAILLNWITSGNTLFQQGIYLSSTEVDSGNEWAFDANNNWNNSGLNQKGKTYGASGSYTFPVTKKIY